jgi:hypothetical protein
VSRIYDNGAIQVYDVSRLMGKQPLPIDKGSQGESVSGTDVPVLIVAGLVSIVWLIRLRRRAQRARINEHQVVCGLVGALVIGVFGAFAIRLLHLRPTPVALLALLILLAVGVWPAVRKRSIASQNRRLAGMPSESVESASEPRSMTVGPKVRRFEATRASPARKANFPRRAHAAQIALGCVGLALFAVGATIATAAARKDQMTPAELSIGTAQVRTSIASVDLGSAAPVSARLEVERFGRTVWSTPLSSGSTWQSVAIPSRLDHSGASAVLVAGGAPIRSVSLPGEP